MFHRLFNLLLLGLILCLTCCKSYNSITEKNINDLLTIEQNHTSYTQKNTSNKVLIPYSFQQLQNKRYIQKFISPWNSTKIYTKKETIYNEFKKLENGKKVAENKQKVSKKWLEKTKKNAYLKKFPNYIKKAITIKNTNLRLLPTNKPIFSEFSDHSNGFPFDNLQNSKLPANTPIKIVHITIDNAWVYIETSFAHGWVSIHDIAYAGPKFIKKFKQHTTYVAPTKDDIPIKTIKGTYLFHAFIGMSFPLISNQKDYYTIGIARASASRYAYFDKAKLFKHVSAKTPIPFSAKNIAKICNNLIDQPYGWGGLFNNRDCSAMIRDIFAPFSIWLPRNSASQAKYGGTYIDINNLTETEKEDFIMKNGKPYATLLWFPGHIMLYIGMKEEETLVFHNIWGLRTTDKHKRKIIGKAVITSLKPGEELASIDSSFNFLSRIQGMTLLAPKY